MENEKENTPPKKRIGRPKKSVSQKPTPRHGIVNNPTDEQHYMEFLFDKPMFFRKIWQFFKLMAVEKVNLSFNKDTILIYCTDHHKKSRISVNIDCNQVNHYYCKEKLDITLSCKNLELIMSTIDKTYSTILFLSTIENIQRNIQIILKNEIGVEETHKVELLGEYERAEYSEFDTKEYPIQFRLPGKYFKKMISDMRSFSDQISIRQDGRNDPLMFEYVKQDKKIKSLYIIKKSKNVQFQSSIDEDYAFRTSFKIDYVKPISSALLSENIDVHVSETKPLLFAIPMDDAIDVNILTDIIDHRLDV